MGACSQYRLFLMADIWRKPNTEEKRSFFEVAWTEKLRKIGTSYVESNKNSPILWRRKMNKFIPLSSLKDTTGIIELCNKAGEPVVVNRNGELKLVIMTKDIFNEYFRIRKPKGELDIEKEYLRRKAVISFVKKTF